MNKVEILKLHVLNASLYIAKWKYYDGAKDMDHVAPIFEGNVKGVFMDEIRSIGMATPVDFMRVKSVLETKNEK